MGNIKVLKLDGIEAIRNLKRMEKFLDSTEL